MDLVREKGLFSFYEDGHGECCRIRKVRPALLCARHLCSAFCACRADCAPAEASSVDCLQHTQPVPAAGAAAALGSLAALLCPLPDARRLMCTQRPSCPLHRCARCASS